MSSRHPHVLFTLRGAGTLTYGSEVLGETEDGIAVEVTEETEALNKADQLTGLTGRFVIDFAVTLRANLARFTARNLAIALGATLDTSSQPGTEIVKLAPSASLVEAKPLLWLGHRADGKPVRIKLPLAGVVPGTSFTVGKNSRALIPVTFEGYVSAESEQLGTIEIGETQPS